MRIVAITQARTGSSRLPGKVLKEIHGMTLLQLHLTRVLGSKLIDQLMVATTILPEDKSIVAIADTLSIRCYQGSVDDVLDRFYKSVEGDNIDFIVRLTSDCPLIDPGLIDKVIQYAINLNLDYCSNTLVPTYPDGQDVEVFKYSALEKAWMEAKLPSEREHVTPYIWKNSTFKGGSIFTSGNFTEQYTLGHLRMTVDEPADFEVIKNLIDAIGIDGSWIDYANWLDKDEKTKQLNRSIARNEGYNRSTNKE
jgi:spore coat polysaccharide biosynthesis protein SpsF (cytidylyltransferase family)